MQYCLRQLTASICAFCLLVFLAVSGQVNAGTPSAPMDQLGLNDLTDAAARQSRIHSLLVAVKGEVVYGQVFRGPGLDEAVNIKSLSKTVHAALVGAAIDREVLAGPDQPITRLLSPPPGASDRLPEVTVGHLLSMQAGLERTSGGNYSAWVSSENWVAYALSRDFVADPGGSMLYSTGSYHILAAALAEATGESLLTLSRRWLGNPMNIRIPDWPRDPQGIHFGGNDMRLSPLALLQFGELYRNGGRHNGTQVLSESWVETSWQPRGRSRFTGDNYGYGWFITDLDGHRTYYGRGFGGQMLYVIPSLDTTIVITADPTPPGQPGVVSQFNRLLSAHLLPVLVAQ